MSSEAIDTTSDLSKVDSAISGLSSSPTAEKKMGHRRTSSSASGVFNVADLEKEGKELEIAKETQKLNWRLNTSPSSIDEPAVLKKFLTTPPVKKIDLHFPLGLEVTARNLKGVTIKDALDAIHKQFKKKADDELELPVLAGFEWDKEESWTRLIVHQKKEGAPSGGKKKSKKGKDDDECSLTSAILDRKIKIRRSSYNEAHPNMEDRASIRPDLPWSNPTVSYWQDPPAHISNHRTSPELPNEADVVIVGSGVTGSTIANECLSREPPPSVIMLESRTACSGATGRNGGHTKHASYRSFLDNMQVHGKEEAARIARFEHRCMKAVHSFARDNNIKCDSWEGDTVDVIYDEGQWKRAKTAVEEMKRALGKDDPAADYTFWGADEAANKFLAKGSLGALSYEAGSLSAYKFVIGVLNLALSKGLNLQTATPAVKIAKNNTIGSWTVETPRGSIKTKKLILATNGYSAHLCPALQGIIVPLRGHMTAQRQGSAMPTGGLATTYSFIYNDGYEYMIQRPQGSKFEGDIMIGGGTTMLPDAGLCEFGTTDDTTTDPAVIDYLKDCTARYFDWGQDHPDGRLRKAWTGIMGYSADGFPLVGELPDEKNLYIAASFQGLGMVLSFLTAKALVSMINGWDDENMDLFPRAFQISRERLAHKFRGRLHTKAPMDLEVKSQS